MKKLFLAGVVALAATSVNAEEPVNVYADCGIGGALFPKHDTAAVISNVIWDLGTTALTSHTASPETCSGKEVAVATYIFDTYANLEEQTVIGEGAHLATLLDKAGCGASSAVVGQLQSNFSEVLSDADYSAKSSIDKSAALYNAFQSAAAGECLI